MSCGKFSDDRVVAAYLERCGRLPLLSLKEERQLAKRIRKGDREALEKLVNANARFVVMLAKGLHRKHWQSISMGDLLNAGHEGALHAAEKFDGRRGIRFVSYASWWIRQRMHGRIAEERLIHVPEGRVTFGRKIRRERERLEWERQRPVSLDEVGQTLCVPLVEVEDILSVTAMPISLDVPYSDDGDHPLYNVLEDEDSPSPALFVRLQAASEAIQRVLEGFPERDREIIRLRFGLEDGVPHTLQEVGERLGVTRERVRQIEARALCWFRRPKNVRALAPHFTRLVRGKEEI